MSWGITQPRSLVGITAAGWRSPLCSWTTEEMPDAFLELHDWSLNPTTPPGPTCHLPTGTMAPHTICPLLPFCHGHLSPLSPSLSLSESSCSSNGMADLGRWSRCQQPCGGAGMRQKQFNRRCGPWIRGEKKKKNNGNQAKLPACTCSVLFVW